MEDLPAPLGPISPVTWASGTTRSTPSTATTPPYVTRNPAATRTSVMRGPLEPRQRRAQTNEGASLSSTPGMGSTRCRRPYTTRQSVSSFYYGVQSGAWVTTAPSPPKTPSTGASPLAGTAGQSGSGPAPKPDHVRISASETSAARGVSPASRVPASPSP